MATRKKQDPSGAEERVKRVLARAIVQAGVERALGETVRLRRDQIIRLEPEGYFEAAKEGMS